ncbi:transcriptional regulator [Aestuariivirga litoralis]|uniref:Transcriptional regulator n=1 Tax=Aestuariivirga litoralis TaxID=2650924 RepID=A0A2W2BSN0_9HYPH|nr:helix-turn-helix domain-containing protein [Aestuariivirga litoralis]PZF78687.1 transcriptional regulator [Aestuariivirga litoralis]
MSEPGPSPDGQRPAAQLIRDELARRRLSRAQLAAMAKVSLSSLEKLLSGQRTPTEQTLIRLEQALDIRLRHEAASAGQVAPAWLGAYSRAAVQWMEGAYLTLRPSSSGSGSIYAYVTEVQWDAAQSCLAFRERERLDGDYAQAGTVSVPHQTGHVYLVTNRHGQYRMAILSRPLIRGEMFGILATLQTGRGSQLLPVAAPLALVPLGEGQKLGRIAAGMAEHSAYAAILKRAVDEDFARLLMPAAPALP